MVIAIFLYIAIHTVEVRLNSYSCNRLRNQIQVMYNVNHQSIVIIAMTIAQDLANIFNTFDRQLDICDQNKDICDQNNVNAFVDFCDNISTCQCQLLVACKDPPIQYWFKDQSRLTIYNRHQYNQSASVTVP